ncbi:hypothetical protein HELRODRAFT_173116 [Helobdella robusta]|uniref:CCHC-type domain-containing protein n=1 Tax=Helobdella robusta TaxID=6412 RepID=T1F6E0_HELRO|nr:hypothetical protein HELRODRAFT_173116 [Helobdella robusta]ESO04045.1 hypothetical protein HELRODRAFT_173116 [Helobdella robusta]
MDRSTRLKTNNQEEESKLDPVQALQMKIMEEEGKLRMKLAEEAKQKEEERKSRLMLEEKERKWRMKLEEEDRRIRRETDIRKIERKEDTEEQLGRKIQQQKKSKDKTFPAFAVRLLSSLRLYFQSRQAESFDKAWSLLVAERMEELLLMNLLDHILTRESEDWFTHDQMADILERYEANMDMICSTSHAAGYKVRPITDQDNLNTKWQKAETKKGPVSVSGCYSCGNTGHFAKHCLRRMKDEPVKRIIKCQVNQMLDGTVKEQAQEGVGKRVQIRKFFKRHFVKVQVQGKQFCDFLVDSGAEETEEYAVPRVSLERDTRNASGKAIRRRIETFDGLAQEGRGRMFYDPEVGLTQWEPWNQEANNNNNDNVRQSVISRFEEEKEEVGKCNKYNSDVGGVRKADVAGLVESEVSSTEQEDDEEGGENGQFDDNSNHVGRSDGWVRDKEDDIGRSPKDEICNNCNVKMLKAVGGPVVEEDDKDNNSNGGLVVESEEVSDEDGDDERKNDEGENDTHTTGTNDCKEVRGKAQRGCTWDGRNSFKNNETVPHCKNIGSMLCYAGSSCSWWKQLRLWLVQLAEVVTSVVGTVGGGSYVGGWYGWRRQLRRWLVRLAEAATSVVGTVGGGSYVGGWYSR